ncbi:TRAP transporter small permease subunit [Bordetella sp. 2513F-2]
MKALLALSRGIDALNLRVGRAVTWVTLLVVLVSAGNAVVRKLFQTSSNAWLELQWYMFGAIFLLAAGYTLLKNEHVRVDILSSMLSRRKQIWIEIFGVVFFLLPACGLIMYLSWPVFMDSYLSNEQSSNSGGLVRWPVKLLIPVGFALLVLAGVSHLIKCVGYLRGQCPDPTAREVGKTAEQELAEQIAREAQAREAALQQQMKEGR